MTATATTQPTVNAILGASKTIYVDHGRKQYLQIIDSLNLPKKDEKYKEKLRSPEILATIPEEPFAIDFFDAKLPIPMISLLDARIISKEIEIEKKVSRLPSGLCLIVAKLGKFDLRKAPVTPLDMIDGKFVQINHRKILGVIKALDPVVNQNYMTSTEGVIILYGTLRKIEKPEKKVRRQRHSSLTFQMSTT